MHIIFFLHFHSSIQTVGRKTEWTISNEARLYLFIFKSVWHGHFQSRYEELPDVCYWAHLMAKWGNVLVSLFFLLSACHFKLCCLEFWELKMCEWARPGPSTSISSQAVHLCQVLYILDFMNDFPRRKGLLFKGKVKKKPWS